MDKAAVFGFVSVPLGAEADHGRIRFILHYAYDPVGGHGVFIQHEGDGLSGLDGVRIHLFT